MFTAQFEGERQPQVGGGEPVFGVVYGGFLPRKRRGIFEEVDIFPETDVGPVEPGGQKHPEIVIETVACLKQIKSEIDRFAGTVPEISVVVREGETAVIDQFDQTEVDARERNAVDGA